VIENTTCFLRGRQIQSPAIDGQTIVGFDTIPEVGGPAVYHHSATLNPSLHFTARTKASSSQDLLQLFPHRGIGLLGLRLDLGLGRVPVGLVSHIRSDLRFGFGGLGVRVVIQLAIECAFIVDVIGVCSE